MNINKCAFVIPIFPPHYKYVQHIVQSLINANVDYYYEVSSGSTSVFRNSLGLLTQTTSIVSTGNGNTAALNVGNTLLVKHHNNAASGIYSVTSVGSSNLWTRSTSYNQSNEITQTIVKVANYTNTIGGNIFYLGKSTTYSNSFSINYDGITVQERFYPYMVHRRQSVLLSLVCILNVQ